MADTARTLTEILTLMADNTTGAISPQDIRDMIVSIAAANGRLSIGSSAATTIAVAGTYYKAAGTTTPGGDSNDVTEATTNRLTYTGVPTRHMEIIVSATVSAVGTDQIVGMKIYHNGAEIPSSLARTIIKASGNAVSITSHADVHMATNDYLEIFVTNESSTGAVTIEQYYFSAKSLFGG
jgi:hypothetical protein